MNRVEVVEVAGEFSLRGGILDVFPPDSSDPIRVEFFGDEVESIRPFDAETQRSLGKVDAVDLTVAPRFDGDDPSAFGHAADAFPEGSWVALVEPNRPPRGGPPLPRPGRGPQRACSRSSRPSPA